MVETRDEARAGVTNRLEVPIASPLSHGRDSVFTVKRLLSLRSNVVAGPLYEEHTLLINKV